MNGVSCNNGRGQDWHEDAKARQREREEAMIARNSASSDRMGSILQSCVIGDHVGEELQPCWQEVDEYKSMSLH